MAADAALSRMLFRFTSLLAALRAGPLDRAALLERVRDAYPATASARPMVDRDVRQLRELGCVIEVSRTRPPVYTLRGGTPVFDETELRTLGLLRDTFSSHHPQASQVHTLLAQLTAGLTDDERRVYQRRMALRVPLDPAIDYTPYAPLFDTLNSAIDRRRTLAFSYQPTGKTTPTLHQRVEPYDIEYRDRHFYLVAYSSTARQILDFRIDRIAFAAGFRVLDPFPPGTEHQPAPIVFRYRLAAALARGEISRRFENQRIVERLPTGDVIIEAADRNAFFIVRTLLRYADSAELLAPPELRAQMAAAVAGLAGMYLST